MRRPSVTRYVRWIPAILAMTWSGSALATPDFPAAVVQDLGLPGITIDPPQGCTLCHTTDAGGSNSLKAFGQLLQQYGATPYNPASLQQALSQVQLNEPQLIDDIKAGRDPSSDTTNVQSPEYGCRMTRNAGGADLPGAALAWAAAVVVLVRRRRFRHRST
jgi:hypothetical protein